jgi:hypothetical protein
VQAPARVHRRRREPEQQQRLHDDGERIGPRRDDRLAGDPLPAEVAVRVVRLVEAPEQERHVEADEHGDEGGGVRPELARAPRREEPHNKEGEGQRGKPLDRRAEPERGAREPPPASSRE